MKNKCSLLICIHKYVCEEASQTNSAPTIGVASWQRLRDYRTECDVYGIMKNKCFLLIVHTNTNTVRTYVKRSLKPIQLRQLGSQAGRGSVTTGQYAIFTASWRTNAFYWLSTQIRMWRSLSNQFCSDNRGGKLAEATWLQKSFKSFTVSNNICIKVIRQVLKCWWGTEVYNPKNRTCSLLNDMLFTTKSIFKNQRYTGT
jgi:hypothetical protein